MDGIINDASDMCENSIDTERERERSLSRGRRGVMEKKKKKKKSNSRLGTLWLPFDSSRGRLTGGPTCAFRRLGPLCSDSGSTKVWTRASTSWWPSWPSLLRGTIGPNKIDGHDGDEYTGSLNEDLSFKYLGGLAVMTEELGPSDVIDVVVLMAEVVVVDLGSASSGTHHVLVVLMMDDDIGGGGGGGRLAAGPVTPRPLVIVVVVILVRMIVLVAVDPLMMDHAACDGNKSLPGIKPVQLKFVS